MVRIDSAVVPTEDEHKFFGAMIYLGERRVDCDAGAPLMLGGHTLQVRLV